MLLNLPVGLPTDGGCRFVFPTGQVSHCALCWLDMQVPYYDYALDLILDSDTASTDILTEEQHELVERWRPATHTAAHASVSGMLQWLRSLLLKLGEATNQSQLCCLTR